MNVRPETLEILRQWVRKAEHDLEKLAALVPAEKQLSLSVTDLVAMNPYAVDVRYGDDWREPQREDAIRSLELAEVVRKEVRGLLPDEALA